MKNNGNKGYERVNSSVTEEFSSKAGRGATEAFDHTQSVSAQIHSGQDDLQVY